MQPKHPLLRLLVLLLALSMFAAACGGGGDGVDDTAGDTTGDTATGEEEEGQKGGTATFAAEQWPKCVNPVTSCAASSWTHFTVLGHVFPRAMEVDEKGEYVASPLLEEAPTEDNGGVKDNPFTITYKIKKDAVWDDGTPITSEDFKFTNEAYLKTTGSQSTKGFDKVESIDTSNPKVAVIKFKEPYAPWRDMFGGGSTYVLKKAAYPSGPDISKEHTTEVKYSGGPFLLQTWNDQGATLVRNEKYWDKERVTMLDSVVWVARKDVNAEIAELVGGQVLAAYPQWFPGIGAKLSAGPVKAEAGQGTSYEGLWLNQAKEPLSDKAVREALAYATDREAVARDLIGKDVQGLKPLNCAGWVPTVGEWCDEQDFADVKYDPAKVASLLQGAGWTKGPDGIFAKGGKKLTLEYVTTTGNVGREQTQLVVQEKARAAGIDLQIKNDDAGNLFDNRLPALQFEVAEYAQVASPDPSVTSIYACDQIPGPQNNKQGQNYLSWCNQRASDLMAQSDRTIDLAEREKLIKQVGDLVRQDLVWVPLYQKPFYTAWRTDRLGGPIGLYKHSSYSGFANMYDWFLKK